MAKIKTSSKNKRMFILAAAFLVLLAIVLFGLEKSNTTNFFGSRLLSNDSSAGPTSEEKQAEAEANANEKGQIIDQGDPKSGSVTNNSPAPSKNIELSAQQEANNTVTVFTKAVGYSDGTCRLTATNSAKTNSQTADLIYQPEFSSCAGFSIPIDSLGKGVWALSLDITSRGSTQNKNISFEVK